MFSRSHAAFTRSGYFSVLVAVSLLGRSRDSLPCDWLLCNIRPIQVRPHLPSQVPSMDYTLQDGTKKMKSAFSVIVFYNSSVN
jgi:hypothetical protein